MRFSGFILAIIFLSSCGPNVQFSMMNRQGGTSTIIGSLSGSKSFSLTPSSFQVHQEALPPNVVSAEFQVLNTNGTTIGGILKDQLDVTENGLPVKNFTLKQTSVGLPKEADIVVVLDVTTSMDPSIAEVKNKIGNFVNALAQSNIKARLCLVQFGEETETVCDKFVEDNPATPQNENYDDFIKKLKNIITHGGGAEPDENQLPALEAAAQKTPWHPGAQRVAILVTDAGFHYAPDNIGEGRNVPVYKDTLDILRKNSLQTFVISDYKYGYSADLKGQPTIPSATGGRFYYLYDVLNGLKDMTEIFDNIAAQISTSYTLEYIVENNPGLDPTLAMQARSLNIAFTGSASSVKIITATSSLPSGKPKARNKFNLGSKINKDTITVLVDQTAVSNFQADDNGIIFDQAPAEGSLITVYFYHQNLREELKFAALVIQPPKAKFDLSTIKVTVNGFLLNSNQFTAKMIDQKSFSIDLNDEMLSSVKDPLEIKKHNGLTLEFKLE